MTEHTDTLPWYKQFWPWFLIALPATAVVGGIVTIIIAMRSPDALVVDDYYKAGLAINDTLERDRQAAELGLSGLLRRDPEQGALRVELQADAAADGARDHLILKLVHPTLSEMDQTLRMQHVEGLKYLAELPELQGGNWHLILTPPDNSWRLTGRLKMPHGGQARLAPGV